MLILETLNRSMKFHLASLRVIFHGTIFSSVIIYKQTPLVCIIKIENSPMLSIRFMNDIGEVAHNYTHTHTHTTQQFLCKRKILKCCRAEEVSQL